MLHISYTDIYVFCAGAVFMAFIYHAVLFVIQKNKLLLYYSAYLFAAGLYLLEKTLMSKVYNDDSSIENFVYNLVDEPIQMLIYITYLQFASRAVDIYRTGHKNILLLFRIVMWIIPIYILLHVITIGFQLLPYRHPIAFIGIRVILMISFVFLFIWFAKFINNLFVKFIIAGTLIMFFGNLMAFISSVLQEYILGIYGVMWTCLALVLDVLCFSAALGYKIRRDNEDKQTAMQQLMAKEKELQQQQLSNLENIYLARDNERTRIARDLHDDIGSTLSSIHIYSVVAKKSIDTDIDKTKKVLEEINVNTQMVMENISEIVWAMKTANTNVIPLSNKIKNLGYEWLTAKNINGKYEIENDADTIEMDADLRRNILLIIKEGLNNICKYSHATEACIKISIQNNLLRVQLSDNGKGFDVNAIPHGNGLPNIEFRARQCGGSVNFSSSASSGTTITCLFPLTNISEKI